MKSLKFKSNLSIFTIWLFTVSGVLGILSDFQNWFLGYTPLHLFLTLVIVLLHFTQFNARLILPLSIPFVLGFIAEILGVNFGLIFGNYSYGQNLGFKCFGVPLMMSVIWTLLIIITSDIARILSKNLLVTSLVASALMTGLDMIIEISAPRFDFWEFDDGVVPIQNYLGWFGTAFIANMGYQYFKVGSSKIISAHAFISIIIFFSIFLFF